MKAAKFFSICEIVCFVGLALSYIGYANFCALLWRMERTRTYLQLGVYSCSGLLIGPLRSVCNLICGCCDVQERLSDPAVRATLWTLRRVP